MPAKQLRNILNGFDAYFAVFLVEIDLAVLKGEKGEVATTAHIAAGVVLGSALAQNDVPGEYGFPAEFLDPEPFAVAVSAVSGSTLSFFMRHGRISCWITLNLSIRFRRVARVIPRSFEACT